MTDAASISDELFVVLFITLITTAYQAQWVGTPILRPTMS